MNSNVDVEGGSRHLNGLPAIPANLFRRGNLGHDVFAGANGSRARREPDGTHVLAGFWRWRCITPYVPDPLRKLPTFNRQYFKALYYVIALAGTAIPGTLFFYAAAHVPAGILAITIALVPMITYIVTWTLGIDAFQARRFVGIFLGFCAILLLSMPDSSLPESGMAKWVMLCLVASCFYAIEGIYLEVKVPEGTDLIALLSASLFMTAIIMLPIIYVQDDFVELAYPFSNLEWVLIAIVLVSSSAYAVFLYAVKIAGAVFATMAGYLITISGVFWGILFFQEAHSTWVWAALVLMLVGMALVTPREKVLV